MKISIVICTYNSNEYLDKQVASFFKESKSKYPIELLFSDDSNETGHVNNLVSKYSSMPNTTIRVLLGPKLGSASSNFLSALSDQSLGDWVFLSDQDDLWSDNKLSSYYSIIEGLDNDVPQIIFSDASLIDGEDCTINNSFYSYQGLTTTVFDNDDILFTNCVQGATLCLNQKMVALLRRSLAGEETNYVLMHDWWIAILAKYCGNWTYIDEPLLKYRQHRKNVVGAVKKSSFLGRLWRNPYIYFQKIKAFKKQYELWIKVSKNLNEESKFERERLSFSLVPRLIFILIRIIS